MMDIEVDTDYKYLTKKAIKEVERIKKQIEQVYAKYCKTLQVVARFSNGETMYALA